MIPLLDLKFIVHYGEYILQSVAGKQKPLGSSVNLIHRLLKNKVHQTTGWRGYTLLTEGSLEQMDVYPISMHMEVESYEHLGNIKTYSGNLDDRYLELTEERRVFLEPQDADLVFTRDYDVSPPVLWEWLNNPQKRTRWMVGSAWEARERPQGRTGRGASNHCSNSNFLERILDWHPFTYYTVQLIKGPLSMTMTSKLEPLDSGVRLSYRVRLNGSLPRWLLRPLCSLIISKGMKMKQGLELLARLINEEKIAQEIAA